MLKVIRRKAKKFFRELLLYHNNSLEYRAKIFTLVVAANEQISSCEEDLLRECACDIYKNDEERCEILVDTIREYFEKIITHNGLDFEHLVFQVEKETRDVKRFSEKIDIDMLLRFQTCAMSDEDRLYQARVIEFLEDLKQRYA
jgi:predicted ATPase with chaperone activity